MVLQRRRPSGFIEPCLPSKVARPPSGPLWVHELKHDGYRLMVRRDGSRVRCFTRGGYDWADRFPAIVDAALRLKASSFLIDGEAVIARDDGTPDFHALRSQRRGSEALLYAFDLIEHDGDDLRDLPLIERIAHPFAPHRTLWPKRPNIWPKIACPIGAKPTKSPQRGQRHGTVTVSQQSYVGAIPEPLRITTFEKILMKFAISIALAALSLLTIVSAALLLLTAAPVCTTTCHGAIAAVLFWVVLTLFVAPLISAQFKISISAALSWVVAGVAALIGVLILAAGLYARYVDRQRAVQQAAYQKSICIERVRLNADLVARGKPQLFPNLTLADCKM